MTPPLADHLRTWSPGYADGTRTPTSMDVAAERPAGAPSADPTPAVAVDRAAADGARARAGQPPLPPDARWTLCSAPSRQLVVDRDGSARACEFACRPLRTDGASDWPDAWRGDDAAALRAALALGQLPLDHCGGCATWAANDLLATAPFVRDHAGGVAGEPDGPTQLVLRLPDGTDLDDDALARLTAALPALASLVVDSRTPWSERIGQRWLRALARGDRSLAIELRATSLGDVDALVAGLRGSPVRAVQLELAGPATTELAAARRLADELGAAVSAWFVLTPESWFQFEEAARACSVHRIALDLRVLGRDGDVPLAALSVEDLAVVKHVVGTTWARCSGSARPPALGEHALGNAAAEIRKLLLRRAEDVLQPPVGVPAAPATATLRLPDLDHPWFTDEQRWPWWQEQLFGAAHAASVRDHFVATLLAPGAAALLRAHPWLRVLCQRLAVHPRHDGLLSLLHDLYAPKAGRAELTAADAAFAAAFDLRRFGGPWAPHLGLDAAPPRRRPFGIGKPRKPRPDVAPDVTVLVPSYRHEHFVGETLRSVLAQRHANFRVLVVDDRSPDATAERARELADPRVDVRVNEVNLGLGNSVLRALESIDTPYVALLNSDDLFHPDRLGRCCAALDDHPEAMAVTTGITLIDADGGELTEQNASLVLDGRHVHGWVHWFARATPASPVPPDRLFAELLERNFLATSSNLVARTEWLRQRAAALRSLKYCLDWQLFLDAARERALHHLPEPLVAYRLHATNTVWFREGHRWAFFVEVNRVLAGALRDFVADAPADEERVVEVLDAVAAHVRENREADTAMMFVQTVVDALDLDRLAHGSPRVQQRLRRLDAAALQQLRLRDQEAASAATADPGVATARRVLVDTMREQLRLEHDRGERLQRQADVLAERGRELRAARQQTETQRQELQGRVASLDAELRQLQQQRHDERARTQAELQQARADLSRALEQSVAIEQLRTMLADDLKALRHEIAELRMHREDLEQSLRQAQAAHAAIAGELETTRDTLATTTTTRDRESQARQQLEAALRRETERARVLADELRRAQQQRDESTAAARQTRAELDTARRSREFRTGNFFWNKLPLGMMSRRAKKWYHRIVDAKDRVALWFRNRYGKHTAEGVAVVASCWHWPIYSHTFVYQEMIGLTHMGLEVRMFHWAENDTSQLQPAFAYLANHRTMIKPVWENLKKDLAHFEATKPGRLRALLERIAPLVGKTVDELYKEPQVLRACTFARMAELAGAKYVHTYFFYDQTFMGMVTAWLLEIPRGISCYADHMLDDFPFKLVALQIELADVVVATSARIKRELSAKSGGRFDDRIVVKPNGVDGDRFPLVERPPRVPADLFEVVSVSRIEPKKGLIHLVEAVASLKARGHRLKANVVGAPDPHNKGSVEFAEALARRIDELGVRDEIVLHGMKMQEEILPMLQRSRAFVAPYVELSSGDKDGIPTAMLEAMACALPVVTTDAGSITEVVADGVEALLVPQRDSTAFAAALERLITQPALERRLAKAARARFDREFDIRVTERKFHQRVADLLHPVAR